MTASLSPTLSPLAVDPSSRKPRRLVPACLAATGVSIIFVSLFLLSLSTRQDFHQKILSSTFFTRLRGSQSPSLPQCPHMLLFTATRHGSTWFVNNVEQCRYTAQDGSGRFKPDVMIRSELWLTGQPGPLVQISPNDAAKYAKGNNTVKVFPYALEQRADDVRALIKEAVRLNVPFALLERNAKAAWASLKEAERSRVWNRNSMRREDNATATSADYESDPDFKIFRDRRVRYFEQVRGMLMSAGGLFDAFDYEDIRGERYIVAKNNGCYVRNCNFE